MMTTVNRKSRRALAPRVDALEGREMLSHAPTPGAGMVHVQARRSAPRFAETNLASDVAGDAPLQDPQLVNGWGIALNPTRGAFWVSDNGTGVTTLYLGDTPNGTPLSKASLVVTIPGGVPTGQVANLGSAFAIPVPGGGTVPSFFIFATESGGIAAWGPALVPNTQAVSVATTPGATYKGITIAQSNAGPRLLAADFAGGKIDVFDGNFQPVSLSANAFRDTKIPQNFAPFNVQEVNGLVIVTYAKKGSSGDDVAGRGNGFVDVFDADGNLLKRLVRHGQLNSPWGVTAAPESFGKFAGALLVGNFGDGRINAFSRKGRFLGALSTRPGRPIVVPGLWGITPGNGISAGRTDRIYFAAGPGGEAHGLFGSIQPA